METKELAKLLGISHQMANRLKKRGMPTDSLEAAMEWRKRNLDVTQTKSWRIDGNSGMKPATRSNKNTKDLTVTEALTHVVPELWFSQIAWLGGALRDHGVKITADQLIKVQVLLFYAYMGEVDDLFVLVPT